LAILIIANDEHNLAMLIIAKFLLQTTCAIHDNEPETLSLLIIVFQHNLATLIVVFQHNLATLMIVFQHNLATLIIAKQYL